MEDEICDALFFDLGRDRFASKLIEISTCENAADFD